MSSYRVLFSLVGLTSFGVVACSGDNIEFPGAGGGGSAPAVSSSSSGVGGMDAVSSSATSTSTAASSSASGGGNECQGWEDPVCGPDAYCQPDGDMCGGAGTCLKRPESCTEDCPGVCACDGKVHCNTCKANVQGVAVAADAKCEPEADGDYTSFAWPGGLDHVVIAKKDTKQNVCLRIQIDYPNDFPLFPLTMPSQWGASQISLSNNAADCDDLKKPPTGAQAWAKAATGSISWPPSKGMLYPCKIDMDVSITVDFPPPGVQANQEMKAQMIHVEGGCM